MDKINFPATTCHDCEQPIEEGDRDRILYSDVIREETNREVFRHPGTETYTYHPQCEPDPATNPHEISE